MRTFKGHEAQSKSCLAHLLSSNFCPFSFFLFLFFFFIPLIMMWLQEMSQIPDLGSGRPQSWPRFPCADVGPLRCRP